MQEGASRKGLIVGISGAYRATECDQLASCGQGPMRPQTSQMSRLGLADTDHQSLRIATMMKGEAMLMTLLRRDWGKDSAKKKQRFSMLAPLWIQAHIMAIDSYAQATARDRGARMTNASMRQSKPIGTWFGILIRTQWHICLRASFTGTFITTAPSPRRSAWLPPKCVPPDWTCRHSSSNGPGTCAKLLMHPKWLHWIA